MAFNGIPAQYLAYPIKVKPNSQARFFVLNAGPSEVSSFHIVGTIFDKGLASVAGIRPSVVDVPLMIDPPYTNALVFHTQSPGFAPARFVEDWYATLRRSGVDTTEIRHTMFLRPVRGSDVATDRQPPNKRTVDFHLLPTQTAQRPDEFRLLHLGRVSDWSPNTTVDPAKHVVIRDVSTHDRIARTDADR